MSVFWLLIWGPFQALFHFVFICGRKFNVKYGLILSFISLGVHPYLSMRGVNTSDLFFHRVDVNGVIALYHWHPSKIL